MSAVAAASSYLHIAYRQQFTTEFSNPAVLDCLSLGLVRKTLLPCRPDLVAVSNLTAVDNALRTVRRRYLIQPHPGCGTHPGGGRKMPILADMHVLLIRGLSGSFIAILCAKRRAKSSRVRYIWNRSRFEPHTPGPGCWVRS